MRRCAISPRSSLAGCWEPVELVDAVQEWIGSELTAQEPGSRTCPAGTLRADGEPRYEVTEAGSRRIEEC